MSVSERVLAAFADEAGACIVTLDYVNSLGACEALALRVENASASPVRVRIESDGGAVMDRLFDPAGPSGAEEEPLAFSFTLAGRQFEGVALQIDWPAA